MEKAVSTFQNVVEVEQRNGGSQKNDPWMKTKTLLEVQTRNRGRIKTSRDGKELKAIP